MPALWRYCAGAWVGPGVRVHVQRKAGGPVLNLRVQEGVGARRDRARVSLARSAAYVGIVARAERDAVAGVDGAGQLVELRGDVALCASRGGPPA